MSQIEKVSLYFLILKEQFLTNIADKYLYKMEDNMWSLDSVKTEGFELKPSVKASLKEFIADLERAAPFHSGFQAKIQKLGKTYQIHMMVECGTYMVEQKIESENLDEIIYYSFQASYAKILEQENSKVQAIHSSNLNEEKKPKLVS